MPWLTPNEPPEETDCRRLLIPADSGWLALISGALTELTYTYNWQEFGDLTPAETVAKMREIIDGYYDVPCSTCTLPGGGSIIRIGSGGHLEELGDGGSWGSPTGDYIIPPPEARTDGTAPDQNCLAAKNAVNVLEQLYETLSEQWASHVSEAEALTEFAVAAIALVGFEFAPITFAIAAFFEVAFAALYTALEYLGADLWDANFSKQIECFLLTCVNNDAGVVTFDWDCFLAQLNTLTDSFGLSEVQIRLYIQVTYMLYFIGGVDGLNLAARTTEITNDDCSFCDLPWCYTWDFTASNGGWTPQVISGLDFATYSAGNGWGARIQSDGCSNHAYWYIEKAVSPSASNWESIEVEYASAVGSFDGLAMYQIKSGSAVNTSAFTNGSTTTHDATLAPVDTDTLRINLNKCGMTQLYIVRITVRGVGENPFGTDNCE